MIFAADASRWRRLARTAALANGRPTPSAAIEQIFPDRTRAGPSRARETGLDCPRTIHPSGNWSIGGWQSKSGNRVPARFALASAARTLASDARRADRPAREPPARRKACEDRVIALSMGVLLAPLFENITRTLASGEGKFSDGRRRRPGRRVEAGRPGGPRGAPTPQDRLETRSMAGLPAVRARSVPDGRRRLG